MEYIQEVSRADILSSCLFLNINSNKSIKNYKIINNNISNKISILNLYNFFNRRITCLIFTPFRNINQWLDICKKCKMEIFICSKPEHFTYININNEVYNNANICVFIPIRLFTAYDIFTSLNQYQSFEFLIIDDDINLSLKPKSIKYNYLFHICNHIISFDNYYFNINYKCKFKDVIFITLTKYVIVLGDYIVEPQFSVIIRNQLEYESNYYIPSNKFNNITNQMTYLKNQSKNIIYFKNDYDKLFWMIMYPFLKDTISINNIEYYNILKHINSIKLTNQNLYTFALRIYNIIYTQLYNCFICNNKLPTTILLCCLTCVHQSCIINNTCPNCNCINPIKFDKHISFNDILYKKLISLYESSPNNHIFICKYKKMIKLVNDICKYKTKKIFPIYITDLNSNKLQNASTITYITNFNYNIDELIIKENRINRTIPIILNVVQC